MKKRKIIVIIIIVIGIIAIIAFSIINIMNDINNEFDYSNIVEDKSNIQEVVEEKANVIKIHIAGEVNRTGIIELEEGLRIADAIEKAGGTTINADLSKVNLAYVLEDGQKLYIPNSEDIDNTQYISENNGDNIIETTNSATSSTKVNINKASIDEFQKLPGVGPSLAQKILNYREENGKFNNIEDIKNVSGIGDKKYEGLKDYIEVK